MGRKERRAALKAEEKKFGYKLSPKEKIKFHESTIKIGKSEHNKFVERAERVNSELEGNANYEMYQSLLNFYNDEEKALAEYKKIMEHREAKGNKTSEQSN